VAERRREGGLDHLFHRGLRRGDHQCGGIRS
jgi:hypothetical protein